MNDHLFVSGIREEWWTLHPHGLRKIRTHLELGYALTWFEGSGTVRVSTSTDLATLHGCSFLDRSSTSVEQGLHQALAPANVEELYSKGIGSGEMRVRSRARYVTQGEQPIQSADTIVTVISGGRSLVTTPQNLEVDLAARARPSAPQAAVPDKAIPTLWLNGTGAVLFHELLGHPAELIRPAPPLPGWLSVIDDPLRPGIGSFSHDDTGAPALTVNLGQGEQPAGFRRDSFRDPPLHRMSNVAVTHQGAPFATPAVAIEIHGVAGGHYEDLTDSVTLLVERADLRSGDERRPLLPFRFSATRSQIAAAIVGARGGPVNYPGVLCSREGHQLAVGSSAPDILLREIR